MSAVSLIGNNLGEIEDEIAYSNLSELAAIVSSYNWAPALFRERKRTMANLSRIELLVLDVDDGCPLERAKDQFKDYRHIIATSKNHQKEKNGKIADRYRVVVFLSEPIQTDRDFKATWARAYGHWPFIDKACKDSARFFYASPNIVSLNEDGKLFEVAKHEYLDDVLGEAKHIPPEFGPPTERGELWKSTLEFLLNGAPAGTRHNRLVQAVGNMREQGYTKPETLSKLQEMSERGDWTQPGLNAADLRTVDRMYMRDLKYGYQPKSEQEVCPSLIVNANELLDEAFSYLSDKEKVKGEPTGIEGLDDLLGGGFRTGELTVLMAQAKTGKNTLYHYLMYKHLERGIPFGYASRELNPATEVVPNLLSIALQRNAWTQDITEDFKARAVKVLSQWSLFFAPGYGYFPIADMEQWFKKLKHECGVDHFLFDHFHYALLGEDYDATTSLIKKLKSITKELDIHLSLIVQPRSLREGEQLGLTTLRGGAAIGQALDNLLILERVKGEQNISKLTLEVARHKLAKLGHIYLQYDTSTTSFIEVDRNLVSQTPMPQGADPRGKYGGKPWPRLQG